MTQFTSGDRPIGAEWFDGAGSAARKPAVLMLHGADGLSRVEQYRAGARAVAAAGYHVVLLHYLDRTGDRWASLPQIFRHFADWSETLRDALSWLERHPKVDGTRIGVIGISLGAALSLATAAVDTRIKALVNYFGPAPQGALEAARRFPPTLTLHGANDRVVPVANAYAIGEALTSLGVPHETKIYPGQGHGFSGEAQADAARRVVAFLGRYLGRT